MKTVLVCYLPSNVALSIDEVQRRGLKLYGFRTESDVKPGDVIKSDRYDSPMQIVSVIPADFTHFDRGTSSLFTYRYPGAEELRVLVVEKAVYSKAIRATKI